MKFSGVRVQRASGLSILWYSRIITRPELVGGQRGGLGPGQDGRAQADREQDGRDDGTHGYWVDFVRAEVLGLSAAAV